ncbi:hypothetical protein OROMI_025890 [Orobanche minor]
MEKCRTKKGLGVHVKNCILWVAKPQRVTLEKHTYDL